MDLNKYGLKFHFDKKTDFKKMNVSSMNKALTKKNLFGDLISFVFSSGEYTVSKKLGQGTYGAAYEVIDKDLKSYAVKKIQIRNDNIGAIIKESVIQILLAEVSKEEHNGPYVPIFYELGYDKKEKSILLRIELLDKTFDDIVHMHSKTENNRVIPLSIAYIAKILDFFSKRVAFNHRDLKGDNIMIKVMPNGKAALKLIDFGLSCLTWKGVEIRGEGYSGLKQCYKKDRDLSQFLYSIARYDTNFISDELYDRIGRILQANVNKNHTCSVLEDCDAHGLRNWPSSYNFFNRPNVEMPYGDPEFVRKDMKGFVVGEPFQGEQVQLAPAPAPAPVPVPEELMEGPEPKNKNKNKNKTVKNKEKPCGPGKMRNPVTKRCKKIPLPISVLKPKECPPGKIINPKTNRCIKDRK